MACPYSLRQTPLLVSGGGHPEHPPLEGVDSGQRTHRGRHGGRVPGGGHPDDRSHRHEPSIPIGEEIKKTTRRVNALEQVVIPRIRGEIRFIRDVLEQRAREDVFRLKRIKKKLEANASGAA